MKKEHLEAEGPAPFPANEPHDAHEPKESPASLTFTRTEAERLAEFLAHEAVEALARRLYEIGPVRKLVDSLKAGKEIRVR